MTLADVLAKSNYNELTDQKALNALLGDGEPLLNSSLQTIDAVFKVFGMDGTNVILNTLAEIGAMNPVVAAAREKLINYGWDFSDPDRQDQIAALGPQAGWDADFIAQFKAMGVTPQTVWQNERLPAAPTLDQITTARRIAATASWWTTFQNEVVNARLNTDTTDELKAAIIAAISNT